MDSATSGDRRSRRRRLGNGRMGRSGYGEMASGDMSRGDPGEQPRKCLTGEISQRRRHRIRSFKSLPKFSIIVDSEDLFQGTGRGNKSLKCMEYRIPITDIDVAKMPANNFQLSL
jgi:hypothetical protein